VVPDPRSLGVLLDHAQDAVVLVDERGRVTYANSAVERNLGYDPDAVVGTDAFASVHPDDVPTVRDAMRCLSEGKSVDVEYRVNPGADYGVWVWVQAEPVVVDGEVVRITGFSRDVTDRRRRERQLYVMDNLLRHNLRNDLTLMLGHADAIAAEHPAVADRTTAIRDTREALLESAEKERRVIDLLTSDPATRTDDAPAIPDLEADVLTGAEQMTHVQHSSGLGLWPVYWVVELSGGRIAVESTADGNRVTVALAKQRR
jgi:PAS domain S-box-containing protein